MQKGGKDLLIFTVWGLFLLWFFRFVAKSKKLLGSHHMLFVGDQQRHCNSPCWLLASWDPSCVCKGRIGQSDFFGVLFVRLRGSSWHVFQTRQSWNSKCIPSFCHWFRASDSITRLLREEMRCAGVIDRFYLCRRNKFTRTRDRTRVLHNAGSPINRNYDFFPKLLSIASRHLVPADHLFASQWHLRSVHLVPSHQFSDKSHLSASTSHVTRFSQSHQIFLLRFPRPSLTCHPHHHWVKYHLKWHDSHWFQQAFTKWKKNTTFFLPPTKKNQPQPNKHQQPKQK